MISIDALSIPDLLPFWRAVLDFQPAPGWWVLAHPEGNEACVATWVSCD